MKNQNLLFVWFETKKEEAVKKFEVVLRPDSYVRLSKNVWIVKTSRDKSELRDQLEKVSTGFDKIFVIDICEADWVSLGIDREITNAIKEWQAVLDF